MWWSMPVMFALSQEDNHKLKITLGIYIVPPRLARETVRPRLTKEKGMACVIHLLTALLSCELTNLF